MNRRGFLAAACAAVAGGVALGGFANTSTETNGLLRENVPMGSDILGMDVPYTVYLPSADSQDEELPVLYLLHGGTTDNNTTWADSGEVKKTLDRLITARRIPPMAVICPDGRREPTVRADVQPRTYYMNDADGQFRYEDMFMQELIPHVESKFGIGGTQTKRGIGGYSMGGFGALMYAMLYPGTFAGAAGLSASHRTEEQLVDMDLEEYNRLFGPAWGYDLEGEDRINELSQHYNLVDIIRRTPREQLQSTDFYLDIGNSDTGSLEANEEIRDALVDKRLNHDFRTHPGGHSWEFWRPALDRVLDFMNAQFTDDGNTLFGLF